MLTRPYIPLGCTQQGRRVPTKLTRAHLDARQAEREAAPLSLPDLLLSKGAMTGPHKRTRPFRRTRMGRFFRALLAFLAAPRPFL